jgi:ankyrin repeat protein
VLHLAARGDDAALVSDLVRAGADPAVLTDAGDTAATAAARAGARAALAVLLGDRAVRSAWLVSPVGGETVLHAAAAAGNLPCLRAVLVWIAANGRNGDDDADNDNANDNADNDNANDDVGGAGGGGWVAVDTRDWFGVTALTPAALADAGSVVDALVGAGATVDALDTGYKRTPLMAACAGGAGVPIDVAWADVAEGRRRLERYIEWDSSSGGAQHEDGQGRHCGSSSHNDGDGNGGGTFGNDVSIDIAAIARSGSSGSAGAASRGASDSSVGTAGTGETEAEDAEDADRCAPLWAVARLLAAGADPRATDERGHTALHMAAYCRSVDDTMGGSPGLVETLLGAGADPLARGEDGLTALDLALAAGHMAIAAVLAPRTLARCGESRTVAAVLSGAPVDGLLAGHINAADAAAAAAPSAPGLSLVGAAAIRGSAELVDALEQAGRLRGGGDELLPEALRLAAVHADATTCAALARLAGPRGCAARGRFHGRNALHLACARGDIDVVREIALAGCTAGAAAAASQDDWGLFPSDYLRRHSHLSAAAEVWTAEIGPLLPGGRLHDAVRQRDAALLAVAIASAAAADHGGIDAGAPRPGNTGADRGAADSATAAEAASSAADGPLDARDPHGMTPLHWCARLDFAAGIAALCGAGARANATYCGGYTPLDLATAAGCHAATAALKERGGILGKTKEGC